MDLKLQVEIRREEPEDFFEVENLTREAFWNLHVPGCDEHLVAHKLRKSVDFVPELDYVAVSDGKIVGNIMYTHSNIVGVDGEKFPAVTFGPLSVLPEHQKKGIGAALVRHSIKAAAEMGFAAIFIYGHPEYYRRFGFQSAAKFRVSRPDGEFAPALMALPLRENALSGVCGKFFESSAFEVPETELVEFDKLFAPKEKQATETQSEFRRIASMREEIPFHLPIVQELQAEKEVFWLNPGCERPARPDSSAISEADIDAAEARLLRFAPYIEAEFGVAGGIIESPLTELPQMRQDAPFYLKCDNLLPISGSIKARGGIYEVLCVAERIALESGMLKPGDDYSVLSEPRFKKLFGEYSIGVGSTGNLGLSIGIMSAKLGFSVSVHMSADARKWKKDLLRQKGARVIEYPGDYSLAITEGRKLAEADSRCHFVDDENSKDLLVGYAVAARRLQKQLAEQNIAVDAEHPLVVYLPCGVGGGPGGITLGLKYIFGDNVRCVFAEPTGAPCMLLSLATGLGDRVSVQDIGLSGKTAADGLAVGRSSRLVCDAVGKFIDGAYTVSDDAMIELMRRLYTAENIFIEPSAASGLAGYYRSPQDGLKNATHIAWATGGGMVPEAERREYLGL